jgi:hypothetical protein
VKGNEDANPDKVWVEDPDGNSWEVFVVKADARDERGHERLLRSETSGRVRIA